MRQVPQNLNSSPFLLIGSGRLARHLSHYFDLENIALATWARKSLEDDSQTDLKQKISAAKIVLLAISDSDLQSFVREHDLKDKTCIHFSGALQVEGAFSFHPLMSFSTDLYSLETYRSIHFVLEAGAPNFSEVFGQLRNQFSYLKNDQRALYHSLCSISGNFSVLLWEYTAQRFEKDLGLKAEILKPYLVQISENLANSLGEKSVLTGPLVRRDELTIEKHLSALEADPMKKVYEAFVSFYQKSGQQNGQQRGTP